MKSRFEGALRIHPRENGMVAAGCCFPDGEVVRVSLLIAGKDSGFDSVRVARLLFSINELVVSLPVRIGLRASKGSENHGAALPLAEKANQLCGITGEQKV